MAACVGEDFAVYKFLATGAPDPAGRRTMPDRLADITNVKDRGAKGDNSTDDTAAIQSAINYCLSLLDGHGNSKTPGGIVFFPPGVYVLLGHLNVGTNDINISQYGVHLVGSGKGITILQGNYSSGFLVSQGVSNAYDCLARIEGISVINGSSTSGSGAIKAARANFVIDGATTAGFIGIDATQAANAYIARWTGGGPQGVGVANGSPPGGVVGSIGALIGDGGILTSCRTSGSLDIGYALSGNGATLYGSSSEVQNNGCRLGWGWTGSAYGEVAAIGCSVIGFQTERDTCGVDLYNCESCFVGGCIVGVGEGMPDPVAITVLDWDGANTVTVTAPAHNVTGTQKLQLNLPLDWYPTGADVSAPIKCTVISGTQYTYTGLTVQPVPFHGTVSSMSYNAGTHAVTVNFPSALPKLIPVGTVITLAGMNGTWNPGTPGVPFTVTVIAPSTTTSFTYAGPSATPSGTSSGTWTQQPGNWTWPQQYVFRCRIVHNCTLAGNIATLNCSEAAVDLAYNLTLAYPPVAIGSPATNHSGNVVLGLTVQRGWKLPTTTSNLNGWKFINCDGTAGWFAGETVANPNGQMVFADLPASPIETQEYSIKDSPTAASGNFGVAVTIGGGTNHVKLRYDNTSWRISG